MPPFPQMAHIQGDNIYKNFLVDALGLMTLLSWDVLLVYLQAEGVEREADKGLRNRNQNNNKSLSE